MDKPWKVVLAFVGVFIAGAIFGGAFTLRATGKHFAEQHPVKAKAAPAAVTSAQQKAPAAPQARVALALMRQFTQRLSLTSSQREKIRPLVSRAAEDLERLSRENLSDTTRVMERMYVDVGEWLTPEQRDDFDEMRRKWQEKAAEERKKRGAAPVADATKKTDGKKSPLPTNEPAARKKEPKATAPRPPGS
ncbi:MAG: hypothetical protein Q7S40_02900 [Opitutaceae bacterium]|nr:hypothetical protein [Opitutaceae bacterium]